MSINSHPKTPFRHDNRSIIIEYIGHSYQDKDHLRRVLSSLLVPPLYTTLRIPVQSEKKRAEILLSKTFLEQSEDMGWNPFKQIIHPTFKDCIVVENRGPIELQKYAKEIIVDVYCGNAVLRGAHVYKQGIIGTPRGLQKGDLVSVFADLDGKCLKGSTSYSGAKLHIGNGVTQVNRSDLYNAASIVQSGIGISMTDPLYQAPSLADLDTNLFFPQNLPSIVCGHALDPQPGETVLDLCAAPGGKTLHLASLMAHKGRIVALEKSMGRMSRMKNFIENNSHSIIQLFCFDSTQAVDQDSGPDGCPPYPPGMFDRILVDAPCSALGQRPCLSNCISLNQLKSFPVIQHKLLSVAVQLLKPRGVLVYSTCTLPMEENENQIHHLLNKYPCMKLIKLPFKIGTTGSANSLLSDEERNQVMRFDPSTFSSSQSISEDPWDRDTIGFFIAKFLKEESSV